MIDLSDANLESLANRLLTEGRVYTHTEAAEVIRALVRERKTLQTRTFLEANAGTKEKTHMAPVPAQFKEFHLNSFNPQNNPILLNRDAIADVQKSTNPGRAVISFTLRDENNEQLFVTLHESYEEIRDWLLSEGTTP